MSLGAVMSPPQNLSRASTFSDFPRLPRSQTPDQMNNNVNGFGSRPYRSGSGSMMQRPAAFEESRTVPTTPLHAPTQPSPTLFQPFSTTHTDEAAERQRRTSISGILQRPNSQPQPAPPLNPSPVPNHAPRWAELPSVTSDRTAPNSSATYATGDPVRNGSVENRNDNRQPAAGSSYDTRPPAAPPKSFPFAPQTRDSNGQTHHDRTTTQPVSPESRRSALAGLLNGPSQTPSSESQSMTRQDSTQSQGDRASDRLDRGRPRFFSPFASSYGHQNQTSSAPPEEPNRKGSDELSHHRALLNIANESKRGRYSPLPQAVQGAQAQTPIPDAGIKSEHGRVFAGLGSGVGTGSNGLTSGPSSLGASPFKRDEGLPRLSEDNLRKMSRSAPSTNTNKRPRKFKDEDAPTGSEPGDASGAIAANGRGSKKSKHHHHHLHYQVDKVDLDNPNSALNVQRRNTPLGSIGPLRRTSTPTTAGNASNVPHHHHHHRLHHHHHHHVPAQPQNSSPHSKRRPVFNIGHILKAVSSNPRRHLGSYVYSPQISIKDAEVTGQSGTVGSGVNGKLHISIRPNLLPAFADPEQLNCTYTVRVSRMWLRHAEREAIRAERRLWGLGIYTDDSDPVAAAMHAGFIKTAFAKDVDTNQLEEISRQYDPVIDGGQENLPSDGPVEPPADKDCHITLLVLPRLERYQGRGRHGLVSRTWGEVSHHPQQHHDGKEEGEAEEVPHDGVSYMVLNVKWVNEGKGDRGQGRTGKERKARLTNDLLNRERDRVKIRRLLDKDMKHL